MNKINIDKNEEYLKAVDLLSQIETRVAQRENWSAQRRHWNIIGVLGFVAIIANAAAKIWS